MDLVVQENNDLLEEVTTLWGEVERLSTLVASLVTAQNQPSLPLPVSTPLAQSNMSAIPISTVFASTP